MWVHEKKIFFLAGPVHFLTRKFSLKKIFFSRFFLLGHFLGILGPKKHVVSKKKNLTKKFFFAHQKKILDPKIRVKFFFPLKTGWKKTFRSNALYQPNFPLPAKWQVLKNNREVVTRTGKEPSRPKNRKNRPFWPEPGTGPGPEESW
jgi:hypothetical protein